MPNFTGNFKVVPYYYIFHPYRKFKICYLEIAMAKGKKRELQ